MPGRHRSESKEEATGVLTFRQRAWEGGENSDLPASVIAPNEVPLLQDLVAFPGFLEGHSGSKKYTATALPGTGAIYAWRQHPVSKKWLLHRGSKLWMADVAMTSWAEVVDWSYGNSYAAVAGDTGSQLFQPYLRGVTASNSNAGVTYWTLTNAATTRTFSVYKDAAHTQLVARGTRSGNGNLHFQAQNTSGLSGTVFVTYTGDDTDAANTLTTVASNSFGIAGPSTIKDLDKDFVIAAKFIGLSNARTVQVNLTTGKFFNLSDASTLNVLYDGRKPLVGSGSQSGGTPYGYRFIYTYCRIVDANGDPAFSSSRITATLEKESAANTFLTQLGTDFQVDYGEFWVANPISAANPLTIHPTDDGTLDGNLLAIAADSHWTHCGLYQVLDIGTNGIDPTSGAGNNREIYIWCGDFDITSPTWSITKTDDELRTIYGSGFGLRTRGWRDLPPGEVLEVTANFLYQAVRGDNQVPYSQLGAKELAGAYQPGFQVLRLDGSIQAIAKSANMVTFIGNNKCWRSSPSVYKDMGPKGDGLALASVFQLRHFVPVDGPIGVTDWSSLTEVETGTFIAHCSDHTIRTWDGMAWSKDLASRKVRRLIRTLVEGSAGGYFAGAFLLWYRNDSAAAYNNKCLRFAFGGDAGEGWSRLARSTWVFPPLYAGAAQCIDANGVTRLLALDSVDGAFYWIETFDSHEGSGLTKQWKDKIAVDGSGGTDIPPAARFRERVGSKESNTLTHQETHLQVRPVDEEAGYLAGFQVSISGYADGNPTAIETVANVPKTGDISFWKEHRGHRLQTSLSFTTSKFRLVGIESRDLEDDRRALGLGAAETDEAGYQRALGATLKHWLTRFSLRLNRARGALYALGGSLPAFVTGPDGRDFAVSFSAGQSLSQADATTYGDFTALFWVKGLATGNKVFQFAGSTFYVSFPSATQISINGTTRAVNSIASGWHGFALVRVGSTVSVYQAGTLLGTVTVAGSFGGTSLTLNPDTGALQLFDFRMLTATLSAAAVAYYTADVLTNAGGKVLP